MKTLNYLATPLLYLILPFAQISAAEGDLYIYPALGQSSELQERDQYECFVWANRETGFNPSTAESIGESNIVRVPVADNPNANAVGVGAILGAIVGITVKDSSRGALVGAGVGAVAGSAVQAQGQRQVEAQARDEAESLLLEQQKLVDQAQNYRRAFSACLEARNYVVR